ncbi:MAG TPA: DNA repair protein RecO [Anaerolineales bacterium]|nr:DNA repair protein RecO [Anaerolineales bacterium]
MPEPKFRSVRVDAVVLRHMDYGEADRLITLYTRQLGKMRVIAKGARKITSRKAGHIEPFTHVKLQLAKGREMHIITQADTVDAYLPLRDDLILTGQASYVMELLDRFTYEDETGNTVIFRLLTDTLARLASRTDPWLVQRHYEMRLLDQLGFRPQLFECVNCGREIKAEGQFFSFRAGGVICPNCGRGLPNLHLISVDALKYLRHFQRSSFAEASRAKPDPEIQSETESLMQGYFTYLLERELNTPGFLKKIKA